jgi:D-aminopeptidase
MAEKTCWETIKTEGGAAFDKLKDVIHEGNVRRVRVRQNGQIVAEFPLTAGVVGAVFAPVLAAVGAIAALLKNCTIEVERVEKAAAATDERGTPAA